MGINPDQNWMSFDRHLTKDVNQQLMYLRNYFMQVIYLACIADARISKIRLFKDTYGKTVKHWFKLKAYEVKYSKTVLSLLKRPF